MRRLGQLAARPPSTINENEKQPHFGSTKHLERYPLHRQSLPRRWSTLFPTIWSVAESCRRRCPFSSVFGDFPSTKFNPDTHSNGRSVLCLHFIFPIQKSSSDELRDCRERRRPDPLLPLFTGGPALPSSPSRHRWIISWDISRRRILQISAQPDTRGIAKIRTV